MDNALAGTLQMFQSRAVPWGGINRGPKRQQLKTFKLFTISKANGRRNRPDLHHFPGNRPGPNQKLVASHSEYAYFGSRVSDQLSNTAVASEPICGEVGAWLTILRRALRFTF